jgi:hypothetical protein
MKIGSPEMLYEDRHGETSRQIFGSLSHNTPNIIPALIYEM